MAVGGLGRDCVAVMQTTESRQGDNLLSCGSSKLNAARFTVKTSWRGLPKNTG